MKLFCFDTVIVETDGAAGQNTVDVGQNEPDVFYRCARYHDLLSWSEVDILMTVAFSFADCVG